jgi:hypothetical protein
MSECHRGGEGAGLITVGYYETCKHQPLLPNINDNVPGLMYSDKAVFTLMEPHEVKVKLADSRRLLLNLKKSQLRLNKDVIRIDQRRVVKKIFDSKPEGRRKVGRPRLRWLDDVENDLRVMKVKRWRIKAQNREEWASVIKEAKVLKDRRAKAQARLNKCRLE